MNVIIAWVKGCSLNILSLIRLIKKPQIIKRNAFKPRGPAEKTSLVMPTKKIGRLACFVSNLSEKNITKIINRSGLIVQGLKCWNKADWISEAHSNKMNNVIKRLMAHCLFSNYDNDRQFRRIHSGQ